jgi:hypothetical protein
MSHIIIWNMVELICGATRVNPVREAERDTYFGEHHVSDELGSRSVLVGENELLIIFAIGAASVLNGSGSHQVKVERILLVREPLLH